MLTTGKTKTDLHRIFHKINQQQQANAFSSLMVEKVLGVQKPWKQLNKPALEQMLAAWEQILAKCPKTSDWKTVKVSDRLLSVTANGQRWVDYFGFASWTPAQEFIQEILPDCEWALIRQSGRRLNVSIECKIWRLSPEKHQQLVEAEQSKLIRQDAAIVDNYKSDLSSIDFELAPVNRFSDSFDRIGSRSR